MTDTERDFKEHFGLGAFLEQLTKDAAAYDEDRHWEVNDKRYEKKTGETGEHDFMNRNRFLAGRMKNEPIRKEEEQMNRFLDKQANEERDLKQEALGVGAIGAGGMLVNKNSDKATGIETRYHGTGREAVKGIKEKGLLASKAGEGVSTRRADLKNKLGEEAVSGKVYLGRDKGTSKGYAMQAGVESVGYADGNAATLMADASVSPTEKQRLLNQARKNGAVIKAKIPYNEMNDGTFKTVPNPELKGLTREQFREDKFREAFGDQYDDVPSVVKRIAAIPINAVHKGLGDKTQVIEGDLPSQYIEGGKGYKRQSLGSMMDYAKTNPRRFAGGAAGVGAGVGIAGAGGYGLYDGIKGRIEDSRIPKEAFLDMRLSMEKAAHYYAKK